MPLVHRVAIVSEKGEVKGFLRVAVQAISGVCVALMPLAEVGGFAFASKGGRKNIVQEPI